MEIKISYEGQSILIQCQSVKRLGRSVRISGLSENNYPDLDALLPTPFSFLNGDVIFRQQKGIKIECENISML